MSVINIPDIYIQDGSVYPDLYVYDFSMTTDIVKTRVNLNMHMFSFLQVGKKQVHFAGTSVAVNKEQSLLIRKGNHLWTEFIDSNSKYNCKLLFFSDSKLLSFLNKHSIKTDVSKGNVPCFIIENDKYINSFIDTLFSANYSEGGIMSSLLDIKFEELLLYLINKYDEDFIQYITSLVSHKVSSFRKIVESHLNLSVEEIAFLCNMSLSTFKRCFRREYNTSPGKWLKERRLMKARELMQQGVCAPSDVYHAVGYNSLPAFSTAFKNEFGINPKDIKQLQQ